LKIFISWSGEMSHDAALALRRWLPAVMNSVEPFVSSKDIDPGTRWQMEVAGQLESTNYGLVCVTRENQDAPWLNFEAGALAKVVQLGRVVPIAIDLKPSDIKVPLGQFQAQPATERGFHEVVVVINAACEVPLTEQLLDRSFEKWWGELDSALEKIRARPAAPTSATASGRTDRELVEEVLNTVRSLARQRAAEPSGSPDARERLPSDHPLVIELHRLLDGERYEILHAPKSRMLGIATDHELAHALQRKIIERADVYAVAIKYFPADKARRHTTRADDDCGSPGIGPEA
jgi:hypothetical protein